MLKLRILSFIVVLLSLVSCSNNFIFESEGDCGVYYRIGFKYDYNMKFADAFANEVNSIALYVFDEDSVLVKEIKVNDKNELGTGSFEIPLDLVPGNYTLLAWGGLMDESSFDLLAEPVVGQTKIEEMMVMMCRKENNGTSVVDEDLKPLYHGSMPLEVTAVDGTYTETMSLTKNTNNIKVMLQELSGGDVDADKFIFEITDANGLYGWDNSRLDDETVTYSPWSVRTAVTEMEETRAVTTVTAAVAEHTIGRMTAGKSPVLTVTNRESGELLLKLPVADYALMTKGEYNRNMGDQEFLDRQDDYTMTFFLHEGEWVSSTIIINSWVVVINETDI